MAEKKYGHFDDANREYVITDPKTPWPWINYLVTRISSYPEGKEKGVKQIIVDGKPIEGCIIPCQAGKHEVIVEM